MSTYKRSPAPFVPPIPPDVTSSSESSPVLGSHSGFPDQPPSAGLGRPGLSHQFSSQGPPGSPQPGLIGVPGYGYPAFSDYNEFREFQEYQQEISMNNGTMQRWQQSRKPSAQQTATMRTPQAGHPGLPGGGAGAQMTRGGYYAAPPPAFGYAPAAPPVGYGFSPYPQATPFPYATAGGFPFAGGAAAMFGAGAQGGAPGYATPFMSPLPTQGLLDPPLPASSQALTRPGGSVIGRPGQKAFDMAIGKWLPGPEYAPVLDHLAFNIVKPPVVEIHPLLRPISESRDSSDPFLVFDILFPPNTIHVSTEPPRKSWSKGRKDPASFPRLRVIRLISKYTPWVIQVTSDSPAGISVSDVIAAIHEHYRVNASEDDDWNSVDAAAQSEILMAYKWNRSTEMGAPGGIMPESLLRGDFLMERTMFAGLKPADPELCEEKMGVKDFPATFELLLHTR